MIEKGQTILVCQAASLKDPGSHGFKIATARGDMEIFLVRKGGRIHGYHNRCPHTGINLEWIPNQFLDVTESLIQCATHGALFRIEDGYCLHGPCAGESLQKLQLIIDRGKVMLEVDPV